MKNRPDGRTLSRLLAGLLVAAMLLHPALFADELYVLDGETAGDELGAALVSIEDVDGDLIRDFVVSAPAFDGIVGADSGKVYLISGADGTPIRAFQGETAGDRFGTALAARDDIIVVGAPFFDVASFNDAGKVYVYSASTGASLATYEGEFSFDEFGTAVALADTDADSILDIVIGAPKFDAAPGPDSGRVYVRSGLTGNLLHTLDGSTGDDLYGSAVARAGRIDLDANDDLIIGAPGYDGAAGTDSGRAYLISGDLASTIRIFDGPEAGTGFGSAVDGGGAIDNDGIDDVLVAGETHTEGNRAERGLVRAFSGDTGATLLSKVGERAFDRFGRAVTIADDVDGDGEQDVLVGAAMHDGQKGADSGKAYLYSSDAGDELMQIPGDLGGSEYGSAVARLGDIDADGFPDMAIGARLDDGPNGLDAGRVWIRSGNPVKHCNQGNTNWGADDIQDVLFLNGTAGSGADRRVLAGVGTRIWLAMVKPPAGGNGKYVVHANDRTADFNTLSILPKAIGTSCFEFILQLGATPLAVWNTVGKEDKIGTNEYFGTPLDDPPTASAVFFKLTQGDPVNLPVGTVLTFQGVLIDPATASAGGASLTNAIVLEIF